MSIKEELKCVSIMLGVQYALVAGHRLMRKLFVEVLELYHLVCYCYFK